MERDYNEPIISTKFGNHRFRFYIVPTNGNIEFTVDGEEKRSKIKAILNNRVYFKETLELFIGEDVEFVDYIGISDEEFAMLKSEQNLVNARLKAEKDKVKDWSLENKTKSELLHMIDKHTKKVKHHKIVINGKKQKEKYVVHNFTIGSEHIRYVERMIDGKVIINSDYKVCTDFNRAGGIASKDGELLVWKYYFEKDEPSETDPSHNKGFWETARNMRYSEQICYEIVKRYGDFAKKDASYEKKRGLFSKKKAS